MSEGQVSTVGVPYCKFWSFVMGWKNVKEHYRVKHLVQVTDAGICIGSGYVPDLIVISPTGELVKRYEGGSNEDLTRYQVEMNVDLPKLVELILAPDRFDNAIRVYTYEGAAIVEKFCEETGWPNVTYDGCIMHDNTYSVDRAEAVAWARASAESGVRWARKELVRLQGSIQEWEGRLAGYEAEVACLAKKYPTSSLDPDLS